MGAQPFGFGPEDVEFCEATPEQRQIVWELSGGSWAAPMSADHYSSCEAYLSQQDVSKDNGCRYWVLHLKGYPRQVITSCETTRKPLLISENGVSRAGFAFAIASVFTNPLYRRLGMAALMLRHLQKQMDAQGSNCSVLYSDIGKMYYAALGWKWFPSNQTTLTLLPASSPVIGPESCEGTSKTPSFTHSEPDAVRYLEQEDLKDLWKLDAMQLSKEFDQMLADGKTHIGFVPCYAQLSWQLARSEFVAGTLFEKAPIWKGAITKDAQSWICWAHDWRGEKLKVLRIIHNLSTTVEQRVENTKLLLESALVEASTWGLHNVLVWNPGKVITQGCKAVGNAHPSNIKIVFEDRADASIPSLRWAEGKDVGEAKWDSNYYYCWC
ncbi:hypothetical protein V8F06_007261 [Rhypophila decipiens]